jgi:hypothetical protein
MGERRDFSEGDVENKKIQEFVENMPISPIEKEWLKYFYIQDAILYGLVAKCAEEEDVAAATEKLRDYLSGHIRFSILNEYLQELFFTEKGFAFSPRDRKYLRENLLRYQDELMRIFLLIKQQKLSEADPLIENLQKTVAEAILAGDNLERQRDRPVAAPKRELSKEDEELLNVLKGMSGIRREEVGAALPDSPWVRRQLERIRDKPELKENLQGQFREDWYRFLHSNNKSGADSFKYDSSGNYKKIEPEEK